MARKSYSLEDLGRLYGKDQKALDFNEDNIRRLFGHEAAEDESIDRLKEYYLKTDIYSSLKSNVPLFVVVGHKGVGKSALLKVLCSEDIDNGYIPITLQPNDIFAVDISGMNFLQKIETWKNGIAQIIFHKLVLSVNDNINQKVKNQKLSDWIDRFGTLAFTMLGKKLSALQEEHIQLSVGQFTSLFKNALFEEKRINIYIDDLDRGWENTNEDVKNLSAMINAIRDLSRETTNLKFRIALRSDVYYAVRTSDETTDKIDGSVLWQSWTNHEILIMLFKRIETFFGRDIDEAYLLGQQQKNIGSLLSTVFDERFRGTGHWENAPMYRVLMSLIRKRPRDLVKLCTLAARKAKLRGHKLILTADLAEVFNNYSNDRLTDTSTEYKSELPNLHELLLKMKPTTKEKQLDSPSLFPRDSLLKKLDDILSMSHFSFKDGKAVNSQTLAAFLYKINFITARKDLEGGTIQRIYYDENRYIYNEFTDFGYAYEIHPAYRWALQPDSIQCLFSQIQLSD